jgi:GTP-binding protein
VGLPSVLFLGRSNVGKSSLINRLLGIRDLARTSSRPGRTRSVDFYRVNEALHFVDLPGYGYAAVPQHVRRSWASMVESFLERSRERAVLAILIVDARRGLTPLDRLMRGWLEARAIPYVVAATKSDKLSGATRLPATRRIRRDLGEEGPEPIPVSARTGAGIGRIWRHLDEALQGIRSGARPGSG